MDPFAVEDPSDLLDWQVPLSFMKSRHSSVADDSNDSKTANDSWRVKDRASLMGLACDLLDVL